MKAKVDIVMEHSIIGKKKKAGQTESIYLDIFLPILFHEFIDVLPSIEEITHFVYWIDVESIDRRYRYNKGQL